MTIIKVIVGRKRRPYHLIYAPIVKDHLRAVEAKPYSLIRTTIDSNSRPLEFDSSWFAHSDSYSMIRHGLRAEKGVWWGCAAAKTSSKLTISDMFGELTAHRERDAGPASPQSARQFLGIQHPITRNSQRPASAV